MRFYIAVGIVGASVMALQILQSRIFSVVTWYHLSFLTISIAMFGLTLGALEVYRGSKEDQRRNLGKMLSDASFSFGLLTLLTLMVQICVPIIDNNFRSIALTLPLVAGVAAAGYYQAGKIISLCLTRSSLPVGKVYAADLVGAAFGCLAAIALMQAIDAPSAVMVVAGGIIANGLLFHCPATSKGRAIIWIVALGISGLGLLNASLDHRPVYPEWTKGFALPRSEISFEEWNAISRITVSPPISKPYAYLWGASPKLPPSTKVDYQYLRVDGAAGTPIIKFDGKHWDTQKYLEYDITNLVHFVPGISSFAVIGAGGGRDLLSALYFGAKRVVALDINDIQIKLLTEYPAFRSYTNLWSQPGVSIINSEARSWFTRNGEKFDALQMSLIDTWVSSGSGAFALTENSLYTVDAWKVFLHSLNEGGVFTVSRWHIPGICNDLCRIASITSEALLETGEKEPWKNVFIAHTGQIATMVVGRNALTPRQLDGLHQAARKMDYAIIASPRQQAKDDVLNNILHARSNQDIAEAIRGLPYDLSPPTDRRPFFFNQARIGHPLEVIKQAREGHMFAQNLRGHAVATVNLYIIVVFSVIASLLVLVLPFRKALALAPGRFIRAGTAYFALIGLGFMLVEITLMQMMSMFLGHPVYGLGIVLFSMILSTGIGSFLSEHYLLDNRRRIITGALSIACYVAMLSASVSPLMETFIAASFAVRVALCIGLIFPCGLMMGFAFPTGMRLTNKVADSLTPWFWGINGATGVVAAALAMIISIGWGLPVTLLAGALCYGLLAFPALRLLKASVHLRLRTR